MTIKDLKALLDIASGNNDDARVFLLCNPDTPDEYEVAIEGIKGRINGVGIFMAD
jgi:hypothetical protein